MLNTRGRQKVKEIINSHDIRFINLNNHDILVFQLSSESKKPISFFNTLNKIGIQYKTIKKENNRWFVKLWPKGERPVTKNTKNTKNMKDKPNRSNYIKRISEKLKLIAEKIRAPSETSIDIFDALSREQGQQEAFLIMKNKLEKYKDKTIERSSFLEWINLEIARRNRVIDSLNKSFKKVTQK